ncbi:MAG: hypothetical protein WC205_18205 [Opitutaceae bacterium]|jgi:hypothetical protein
MKKLLPLLWLTLATTVVGESVNVTFTSVSCGDPVQGVFYVSGGHDEPLIAPAFARSPKQVYRGERRWVFFRLEKFPGEPVSRRVEVATVIVPDEAGRFLLLWSPAATGKYHVVALSEEEEVFPLGQARIYNATPYRVAVKGPSAVLELAPGETRLMGGDGRRLPMQVAYAQAGAWKLAGNNVFALNAHTRRTVLIAGGGNQSFRWTFDGGGADAADVMRILSVDD